MTVGQFKRGWVDYREFKTIPCDPMLLAYCKDDPVRFEGLCELLVLDPWFDTNYKPSDNQT